MKLVIDKEIPFIEGVFEPYAEILYKEGKDIAPKDVADADAMIIRTRTRCDASLLEGSSVKLISLASVGLDNIDIEYCRANSIHVQNASGSSVGGVMNYVFSALYGIAARKSIKLPGMTMGIIGVGNSGRRVEHMATALGLNVLRYDPPRAAKENPDLFCDLDELLEKSDIVTFHVRLNESTKGMADEAFFKKMKQGAILINTARGEIIDENALIQYSQKLGPIIIDAWSNEPNINQDLMAIADIATPHIAGYSYQGKQNGTAAAVRGVARFFGIESLYEFFPEAQVEDDETIKLSRKGKTQGEIALLFQYNYPIFTDDFMFRLAPEKFEELRLNYQYRREFYID